MRWGIPRAWLRIALALGLAPALALLASPRPAAAARLTVRDIFSEPHIEGTRPRGAALAPDEKWVAFAWNAAGLESPLDLWIVPATGGQARALTAFPRDARADSLRAVLARPASPDDSLPGHHLPRYFADDAVDYRAGAITWSPDARRIAFLARGDIYFALPSGPLTRLTATKAGESELSWSPDGRFLAFVRDNSVWALEVDRGRELQLTVAGGDSLQPSSLQWASDGRWLAFLARDEHGQKDLLIPSYLGERVTTGNVKQGFPEIGVRVVGTSWLTHDKGRMDARDPFVSKAVRLGPGNHPQVSAIAWSPDGHRLAISDISADLRTRRILVASPDSCIGRSVYTETDSAWVEEYDWVIADHPVLEFAPDNRSILIASERTGFRHLVRIPLPGGAPEQLTDGKWEVGWARWLPDGRHIILLGARARSSERQLEVLDVASRALRTLGTGPGMATHPSMVARGKRVLYEHSRFNQPTDLFSLGLEDGAAPVPVTHSVPAAFRAVDWVVPEVVEFPAHDGARLKGLLYKPVGFDPHRRYPAVVFVHGAGILQNVVDGWSVYTPNFKFHTVLAQAGFAVFEVDYRGSLGYGRDFRAGVYMHLGGPDLDDEVAGLDYLSTLGWVDPARVGLYGGSYGGFMTLMALFTTPDRWACGAALRFVADWENYNRGNPWYCTQRLGLPEKHPEAYWRSSPIHFAGNLQKPLLLLHGMRDDNVHFQDAAQLVERLIRNGKQFDFMMYPRESHGFTAPASWIDEYGRIQEFFTQHLAPTAGPGGAGAASSGVR